MPGLFDLRATDDPMRFVLAVEPRLTVGPPDRKFLFGGVGLGAGLAALERATGRSTIWASAQFVSFAAVGDTINWRIEILAGGNQTTQARAVASIDGRDAIIVSAALGVRTHPVEGQWARPPAVPPPDECPPTTHREQSDTLLARFEFRVALGGLAGLPPWPADSDGHHAFWLRSTEELAPVRSLLAVVGDFLPSAIAPTIGARSGGNSLDNTIRFIGDTDAAMTGGGWVLCDAQISAIASGIVHGDLRIFDESGRLLAVASQSMILRAFLADRTPS